MSYDPKGSASPAYQDLRVALTPPSLTIVFLFGGEEDKETCRAADKG